MFIFSFFLNCFFFFLFFFLNSLFFFLFFFLKLFSLSPRIVSSSSFLLSVLLEFFFLFLLLTVSSKLFSSSWIVFSPSSPSECISSSFSSPVVFSLRLILESFPLFLVSESFIPIVGSFFLFRVLLHFPVECFSSSSPWSYYYYYKTYGKVNYSNPWFFWLPSLWHFKKIYWCCFFFA